MHGAEKSPLDLTPPLLVANQGLTIIMQPSETASFSLTALPSNGFQLAFTGRINAVNAGSVLKQLTAELTPSKPKSLIVDLAALEYLDDYGVVVLLRLKQIFGLSPETFVLRNVSPEISKVLALTGMTRPSTSISDKPLAETEGLVSSIGDTSIHVLQDLKDILLFLGDVVLAIGRILRRPRCLRWNDVVFYMQRAGVEALPIVALISFLMGLIMAFMSSVQLKQFGANIYVASLVALAMTRELGPIMTAIIVAGRSGSAFASEIASMKIDDEVDALHTMGFDTTLFLVMPKIVAALIVVPILILFSDLVAIIGGLLVGVTILDLTATAYITETLNTLTLFNVFWGMFKGMIFAGLIAWIGCYRGFQTRGGADAVGRSTTSAVVSGIFLIILFDSIFAIILTYW